MNSTPSHSPWDSPQGEWLRWRVAAMLRVLLWRGSVALEKMIYRPHAEVPLVQRVAVPGQFPRSTWHFDAQRGYLLVDSGPDAIGVVPFHPISEN